MNKFGYIGSYCILFNLVFLISHDALGQYYGLEKLNPSINTARFDEISPKVSPDGKTLYFTRVGYSVFDKTLIINGKDYSRHDLFHSTLTTIYNTIGGKNIVQPEQSSFNQDIWSATNAVGVFDNIKHEKYPLNNALPNSVCAFTESGQTLILLNQFFESGGMNEGFSFTQKSGYGENIEYSFPKPIDIDNYYSNSTGVHMHMNEDQSFIVMSLDREDSFGGTDLYISFRISKNVYSEPQNLGPEINSQFDEMAPQLLADDRTIYFSSNRPGLYGNKDIYKSIRKDNSWASWEPPSPLPAPINSESNDNQPFYHESTNQFYFVSDRDQSSDIYRKFYVESLSAVASPLLVSSEPLLPPGKNVLTISTLNAATGKYVDAEIEYVANGSKGRTRTRGGTAVIYMPQPGAVSLSSKSNGFLSFSLDIPKEEVVAQMNASKSIEIVLDSISENTKIQMDPIFFERSTANIKKNSYRALNKLVRLLKRNWNVSITVEGHTDNQGDPDQLKELSEKRANAIRNYLVLKRISPLRIETKGFGAEKPINSNGSEKDRAVNRRVEVLIRKVHDVLSTSDT